MSLDPASLGSPACSLSRKLNATPEQVFEAWTTPARLAQWWGPHGFTNPVCEFEARPGGGIRIDMRGPDGVTYPMTGAVEDVVPPSSLVFSSVALDDHGRAMFKIRTLVDITGEGSHSTVQVRAYVTEKTSAAASHLSGMEAGWTQSLERLEALLDNSSE